MKCPGQDSRYWDGSAIFDSRCPNCGHSIEFFKDDNRRKCPACGQQMLNPEMDFGCASYCPHAAQCLGSLPPELVAKQQDLLIERVHMEMRAYFGDDRRRIEHATRVARHAKEILEAREKLGATGANPAVVLICGYLHDIGIKNAEEKFHSSAGRYQHQEGPPVARAILEGLAANPGLVDEVCDIIGHHHLPRAEETENFKILYDADLITNLEDFHREKPMTPARLERIFEKSFLSREGQELGRRVFAAVIGA